MDYRQRLVDSELKELLLSSGCVVIEGPKAVGKTETARQHASSSVSLDTDVNARLLAQTDAALVLEGASPRLVDEWQIVPEVWNVVRREVDVRGTAGQFILTGSAVPSDDATRHTGAGRMVRMMMRPMTLLETGHSTASVSLAALFDGMVPRAVDRGATIPEIVERICIGGWPVISRLDSAAAQRALRAYLSETARTDIRRVDGIERDPARVQRLLRSIGRNTGTQASLAKLAADAGGADGPVRSETVRGYLASLERLMIVEDVPAWSPALRSRARLRGAMTRHFVDPCLAAAALNASPKALLNDLNFLGFLFESLVVRDLRSYGQAFGARLYHYRDSNDLEVDVVLEHSDGRWAGIEVKLGANQVDDAAQSLLSFVDGLDVTRVARPAFLAVVTATGYAYARPDGVYVVPVGLLGP